MQFIPMLEGFLEQKMDLILAKIHIDMNQRLFRIDRNKFTEMRLNKDQNIRDET